MDKAVKKWVENVNRLNEGNMQIAMEMAFLVGIDHREKVPEVAVAFNILRENGKTISIQETASYFLRVLHKEQAQSQSYETWMRECTAQIMETYGHEALAMTMLNTKASQWNR